MRQKIKDYSIFGVIPTGFVFRWSLWGIAFLICFLGVILSGCVSVQQQLNQSDKILVNSTPAGATVLLNNQVVGMTPMTVKLTRSETSQYLTIVKNNYRSEEIILSSKPQTVDLQKRNMLINSTAFFGGVGLVCGLASGIPLQGLLGGTFLGLLIGLGQEEKGLVTRYEYSPESIDIKLLPLLDK